MFAEPLKVNGGSRAFDHLIFGLVAVLLIGVYVSPAVIAHRRQLEQRKASSD